MTTRRRSRRIDDRPLTALREGTRRSAASGPVANSRDGRRGERAGRHRGATFSHAGDHASDDGRVILAAPVPADGLLHRDGLGAVGQRGRLGCLRFFAVKLSGKGVRLICWWILTEKVKFRTMICYEYYRTNKTVQNHKRV